MDVLGLDIGFGFTKATNGVDSLIFKSIFGEAEEIQFRDQLLADYADQEEFLHIEWDGKAYFIGELAERQSHVRSFTLDQNQFIASFVKPLALAAMGRLMDGKPSFKIVSGLPISYYRRHKEDLKTLLKGKHDLTMVDAAGTRKDISVNVLDAKIIPQPSGSLLDYMLCENGDFRDKRFTKQKVGIIDVGFRTCDYSIADRTKYSQRGSRTTNSGISQAFSIIAAKLRDKSGVNIELYRLYDAVANGSIKIRGTTINIKGLTEAAFSQLASAIATEATRLWGDDWDIDCILITGGGGGVLAPLIKPQLNGEVLNIDLIKDTRLANVRGYHKYAVHLWNRAAANNTKPAAK